MKKKIHDQLIANIPTISIKKNPLIFKYYYCYLDQDQWSKITGALKELMNPLWSWIHRFLWWTLWVVLDHWSWSRSPQRNAPRVSSLQISGIVNRKITQRQQSSMYKQVHDGIVWLWRFLIMGIVSTKACKHCITWIGYTQGTPKHYFIP